MADWPLVYPPRVTALPAGAADGDEIYYVADATNGVVWHFKYNSGSSSSYKWEFVGGGPLVSDPSSGGSDAAAQDVTSTTYVTVSSMSTITLPFAGDYDILVGHNSWHTAAGGGVWLGCSVGGTAAADLKAAHFECAVNSTGQTEASRTFRATGASASDVVTPKVRTSANTGKLRQPYMQIRPVRVG